MSSLSELLRKIMASITGSFSSDAPDNVNAACPENGKCLHNIERTGAGAFKRNADGTIKGEKVGEPYFVGHGGARGVKFLVQEYNLELNDGSNVQALKALGRLDPLTNSIVTDHRMDTDCHGVTFTNGEYWINNDQVDQILSGGGFRKANEAKTGDVLVYRDSKGQVVHSVTVSKVGDAGVPTEVSGLGGIEMSEHYDPPERGWGDPRATREVWTK